MLSNDLAGLTDWLAGYYAREEPLPVHALGNLVGVMLDIVERAELLEQSTIRHPEDDDADAR